MFTAKCIIVKDCETSISIILNLWKSPEAFCRQTLHVEVSKKTSSHQNSCTALLQRVQSSALHIFRAVSSLVHFLLRARSSAVLGIICALHHFSFLGQSELARCSTIRACALLDCVPERVWRRLHALYPVHPRAVEEKRCHTSCSLFSTVSTKFSLGNKIYAFSGPLQLLGSVSRQPPFVSRSHHSPHFIKVFI